MTSPLPRSLDTEAPDEVLELDPPQPLDEQVHLAEDTPAPRENRGAGGRQLLAWTLGVLALLWVGFVAWQAGRSQPDLGALAGWASAAAGPLALLGVAWLIFGRTRRREAERFTRSVHAMQAEARSLEQLLGVLHRRLEEEQAALGTHASQLMRLGDEAGHRLGSVAREFASGSETLSRHAAALDRAAESARNDIGVLLEDLPRAEASSRAMAEELKGAGREASAQAAALEAQLAAISGRAREAEDNVGSVSQRLVAHLTQIESAGAAAATRVGDAGEHASREVEALLARTAEALAEVRTGIDTQAAAVRALVSESAAGLGMAGVAAAEQLGTRLGTAGGALDSLTTRIAEQDRAVSALMANLDRQLAEADQRFVDLAAESDLRAQAAAAAIDRVRRELDGLAQQQVTSGGSLADLQHRTEQLRDAVTSLSRDMMQELSDAVDGAEGSAERLRGTVQAAQPDLEAFRTSASEASTLLESSATALAQQKADVTALLQSLDGGVTGAEGRLAALRTVIEATGEEAARLQAETGPALVQAMVQVREAAAQAAARAREALGAVIPGTAEQLSANTQAALSRAVEEAVSQQLREVEQVAARALASARSASEGLSRQMLNIGQAATALDAHLAKTDADQRAAESEAFARRASTLIDQLHSASIDVGRILSDEVDDRAWAAYLKGDRGVFTRKAVKLLSSSEHRALDAQFGADSDFASAVTRYVADFEAMLRRVSNEPEGGMMAVTLLSSDMGRLYTALAQVVERRR